MGIFQCCYIVYYTELVVFELKLKLDYINEKGQLFDYNQKMKEGTTNQFTEMVQKVIKEGPYSKIFEKQQQLFDLLPYKIEDSSPDKMQKLYNSVLNKYTVTHQLNIDQNNWNQNQRRLFVWFIICYSYFIQLDKLNINQATWDCLSSLFFMKKPAFLHFQYLNLLKSKNRVNWNPHEDSLLIASINSEKPGKWNQISKKMFYDSERTFFRSPKHCRQRWLNHLDINKKHGEWSTKQDYTIFKFVTVNGKRWSRIVPLLNETRTEHMIKNRFNSIISKSKTSRKQKEDETARRVLKQLKKTLESEISEEKSTQLKNQNSQINQPIRQQIIAAAELNEEDRVAQQSQAGSIGFDQLGYTCFVDFNSAMVMNQLYYPQTYFIQETQLPVYCGARFGQNHLFSKNSSFSIYGQEV